VNADCSITPLGQPATAGEYDRGGKWRHGELIRHLPPLVGARRVLQGARLVLLGGRRMIAAHVCRAAARVAGKRTSASRHRPFTVSEKVSRWSAAARTQQFGVGTATGSLARQQGA